MIDHDKNVGTVLQKLDELGIAGDTIVMYGTDNGPHMNSWPDAGMTPFRSEKNSNWEGAYRVPALVRWPGKIKPGTVFNEPMSHMDWLPTLVAAAGMPDIKERLLTGYTAGDKTYKVHLDGYNFLPYLTGEESKGPRTEFFYFSDDGGLTGLRYDNWKFVFMEQRAPGTLAVWSEPFTPLRVPKIFNLRSDPYERADITSNTYYDWMLDHAFLLVPAQSYVAEFLATFKEFRATPEGGKLYRRPSAGETAANIRRLSHLRSNAKPAGISGRSSTRLVGLIKEASEGCEYQQSRTKARGCTGNARSAAAFANCPNSFHPDETLQPEV